MSDLTPSVYTIESKQYPGQYVSGDVNSDPILSFKMGLARIQRWALEYDEEGFAMFQGRSPTFEAKGWIAVDEDGTGLVYTLAGPSKFKLLSAEGFHL
ncbi:hypothetical protein M405DRAFT_141821 [Rhizopogon salebrosus TDB-379]|nr:hypothetical protein M405DRAFT_141821 [Rhizopogon salebrosus TDB-379]